MSAKRLKVLLVEDNPGDSRLIQESLTDASDQRFELETAETLQSGLDRLNCGGIDALLLDLALPDSFGMETFVRAKAQALGVAIIVLTGLNDQSLALKLVQGGAQDFVAKVDISGNNLTRAILYAVERARLEVRFQELNAELEQRVRDRTVDLEASNRELQAFSYSVSHDLRAPLASLIGFADLLGAKCGKELNEQGMRYLSRIQEAAFQMSHLIDDILRLAHVSQQGLLVESVQFSRLVGEVLRDMETEVEKRRIDWQIGALPTIECDRGLMKQVLANLISNAVKYTRTREKAVVEIGQIVAPGRIELFVRDNGVGFDITAADKLFAPFQRLHDATEFEGTGIGLATAQRIVEKHKGRIWAESEPGGGATFFFTIGSESESKGTGRGMANGSEATRNRSSYRYLAASNIPERA